MQRAAKTADMGKRHMAADQRRMHQARLTRRLLLAGVAGAAALPLAGRRAAAGITPGKPFAGQEVKVLTVRATQFAAQYKRLTAFTEQTGIKVTYTDVPFAAMREKLTAEMVAGSSDYDVVSVFDVWVPSMTANFLEPLDSRLAARGIDMARYPAAFSNAGRIGEAYYGLPMRCHCQVLFYRRDLFDEVGLAVPRTWDDVIAAGKVLQDKKGIAGVALPYAKNNGQNLMIWYNFLWGAGGDLFDEKGQPAFNSAAGLKATQDYIDLLLRHKVTPPGAAAFTEQDAANSMQLGNAAMLPTWWWIASQFASPASKVRPEQVGYAALPAYGSAPPSTFTNSWIYGINRNSKARDAAMEYLDFISSAEVERSVLLDPAENDVVTCHWTNLRDAEVNARWHGLQAFGAEALKTPRGIRAFAELPQVIEVLAAAMSNAASGSSDVPTAMNGAASQVARIMRHAH